MDALQIVNFDDADEVREFPLGRFELVRAGGAVIGRAVYEPGWRWSEHVAPEAGTPTCMVEHLGVVVSGRAAVAMDDGEERIMGPGDVFAIPPGHDSWVVGEEPYVSIHVAGAGDYAT
jgi:quercetin dioxygenase-like cupin family protein